MDAPNIKSVRGERPRTLVVIWKGGAESIIDVTQHLAAYQVLTPLRDDDALFLAVDAGEWGWCAHWSEEMEISADSLWRLALEQGSEWLRAWRFERNMTQSQAAAALGVSPRMWRYYEGGFHLLPKTVRLAAMGFDAEFPSLAFLDKRVRGDAAVYQDRLLLYADILGWTHSIHHDSPSVLLAAIERIQEQADSHNERQREELIRRDGKIVQTEGGLARIEIFRGTLEVQFGAFSDHFVYSMPAAFGSRILTTASKLVIDLLHAGYLSRGAIVRGELFHRDNVIVGPALVKAVAMEEREAFYPRILVSQEVAGLSMDRLGSDYQPMLLDHTGRWVVNPFTMPFDGPDQAMDAFFRANRFLPAKAEIDRQIAALEREAKYGPAEKWRYLSKFIEGPVLDAAPKLRRFWQ